MLMQDQVDAKQLSVLASAEFTADMAEGLVRMCAHARDGERVVLQISNRGVWGVTSRGVRIFIGSCSEFQDNAD